MGQYDIDWDATLKDASDNDTRAALPSSDYDVEVLTAEATTFNSGSTGIKTKLRVTSGPFEDRWLWDNLVFKEGQARTISVRNIQNMGVDQDWLKTANPTLVQLAEKLVGLRCTATVGIKTWQGDERNEVKGYKAANGASAPGSVSAAPVRTAPSAEAPPAQPAAPTDAPAPAAASGDGQPPRPF